MSRKATTTVQVDLEVAEKIRSICAEKNWTFSAVATRLLERFVAGDFSGSLSDAISENAGPEYGLTRKYTENAGWIVVPADDSHLTELEVNEK